MPKESDKPTLASNSRTPSGSESKPGGRKVNHNSKACNVCRWRKGKCDGNGKDPCSWCVTRDQDCSYNPEDGRAASWNKMTMESHRSLRASLLATNQALLSQVDALRNVINEMSAKGIPIPTNEDMLNTEDLNALCEKTRLLILQDGKDFALHGEWSPWVDLAPSSPPESTAADTNPLTVVDQFTDYRSAVFAIKDAWKLHFPDGVVLDIDEYKKVTEHFFTFIGAWGLRVIPNLYWRDMYRSLLPGASPTTQRTAHWSPFLLNAVMAVALAMSDIPEVRARSNRELFAKKAKSMLEDEVSNPTLSTVTGFSVLATYHSGRNEHGLGFMYFGISVRMCRALGLTLDCSQWVESGHISKIDESDRHWGLWITYTHDIWWSLYVGREFSINLSHVSIPLPTVESLPPWRGPETMLNIDPTYSSGIVLESFVEVCKLAKLATTIMDVVYGFDRRGAVLNTQLLNSLHTDLTEWFSSLPRSLNINPNSPPCVLMMHIAFWWCIILLHRPSYKRDPHPKSTARKLCLRAARSIVALVEQWKKRYTLRYVPITIMSVIYSAGTTWLYSACERFHKLTTRDMLLNYAEQCVEHLRLIGDLWESGAQLSSMLRKSVEDHRIKIQELDNADAASRVTNDNRASSSISNTPPTEQSGWSTFTTPYDQTTQWLSAPIDNNDFMSVGWMPDLPTADMRMKAVPDHPSDMDWLGPPFWKELGLGYEDVDMPFDGTFM